MAKSIKYTSAYLIKVLLKINKITGKRPRQSNLNLNNDFPSIGPFLDRFGSWRNALLAAGFKPRTKANISKKDLIIELQTLGKKLGFTPRATDADLYEECAAHSTFVVKFGSWEKALLAAGFSVEDDALLWLKWQRLVTKIAKLLYKNIEVGAVDGIRGLVDIYVPDKKLVIDAMVSAYQHKGKNRQIKWYTATGNRLEFWCLHKGKEIRNSKLSYLYADDIIKILKAKKKYKLIQEVLGVRTHIVSFLTKKDVTENIRKVGKITGRKPRLLDFSKINGAISSTTIYNHFDTFNEALIASGYKARIKKGKPYLYDSKKVILHIQRYYESFGKVPTFLEYLNQPGAPSQGVVERIFGSWNKALSAANLVIKKTERYSTASMLRQLIKHQNGNTSWIGHKEWDKLKLKPHSSAIMKRFGGWNNFLKKAGVEQGKTYSYESEDLIKCILMVGRQVGKTPTLEDIKTHSSIKSSGPFYRHFGTFANAVLLAGFDEIKRKYDRQTVTSELTQFIKQHGRLPKRQEFTKAHGLPNRRTVARYLPNYKKLITNKLKA